MIDPISITKQDDNRFEEPSILGFGKPVVSCCNIARNQKCCGTLEKTKVNLRLAFVPRAFYVEGKDKGSE